MPNPTTTRIKRQHERVIGSRLTIDLLNNFDQVWRRHFGKAANVGASLEDYVLLTVVLMGEAEGRLFTAHKLAAYLKVPRSTVQRKLDHLEEVGSVERMEGGQYRISSMWANETSHVDRMVKIIKTASAELSKMGIR
jgi:Fic family protein